MPTGKFVLALIGCKVAEIPLEIAVILMLASAGGVTCDSMVAIKGVGDVVGVGRVGVMVGGSEKISLVGTPSGRVGVASSMPNVGVDSAVGKVGKIAPLAGVI